MASQMKKPLYISKNAISCHQNMSKYDQYPKVCPPSPSPTQTMLYFSGLLVETEGCPLWIPKNQHCLGGGREGEGGLQIYKFILQFDLCLLKFCPRLYIKTNLYRLYVSQFRPWHGHIAEKRIIFQIIIPISLGPNVYGVFPL